MFCWCLSVTLYTGKQFQEYVDPRKIDYIGKKVELYSLSFVKIAITWLCFSKICQHSLVGCGYVFYQLKVIFKCCTWKASTWISVISYDYFSSCYCWNCFIQWLPYILSTLDYAKGLSCCRKLVALLLNMGSARGFIQLYATAVSLDFIYYTVYLILPVGCRFLLLWLLFSAITSFHWWDFCGESCRFVTTGYCFLAGFMSSEHHLADISAFSWDA